VLFEGREFFHVVCGMLYVVMVWDVMLYGVGSSADCYVGDLYI